VLLIVLFSIIHGHLHFKDFFYQDVIKRIIEEGGTIGFKNGNGTVVM